MNTTSSYDLICRDVQRSIAVDPRAALCTLIYEAAAAKLRVKHEDGHAKRVKMLLQTSGEIKVKGVIKAEVLCQNLHDIVSLYPEKAFDLLCYGLSLLELAEDQAGVVLAYALVFDETVASIINTPENEMLETVKEKL
jgi:hypothetical protein